MAIINYILITISLLLTSCNNSSFVNNSGMHLYPDQLTKQATQYLKIAENSKDPIKKNNLLLISAELLIEAHNPLWAEKILTEVNTTILNSTQYATLQILLAKINLIQKNFNHAKELLSSVGTYQELDRDIYKKLHSTKIDIFLQSGEMLEAIQEEINLENFLTTPQEIAENQKNIWNNLQQLTPHSLEIANQGSFNNKMQGWISIAIITKRYDADQAELSKALLQWQQNFPNHPANIILNLPKNPIAEHGYESTSIPNSTRLNKIALLLPISGPHKQSALAIKNGFLAALYNKKSETKKPKIIVLDTNEQSITNVYKQAINIGADFIVGPLIKKELESLVRSTQLSVPVLALNTLQESYSHSNVLFQFGLPPETESIAITEKAWENHHKNALLIAQNNELGKRMLQSITKNWHDKGGHIIHVVQINSKTDLNKTLRIALGIEDSDNRAKDLTSLGLKFNFEPRRRQDIDCIFLVTNAENARQIKPLLNFYYAGKIPIYAASNIYTGIKNPLDRDLDHIQFCDMPWMLDNSIHNRLIYQSIKNLWGKNFAQYSRLYALGVDAYKISNQMQQLLTMPEIGISGMTGILRIDPKNVISRKLMWGTFENGAAIVLNQKN